MKVLIVTPHVFAGGAEKAILNLAYQLNYMGCDTSIVTLSVDLSNLPKYFAELNFILPKRQLEQPVMNSVCSIMSSMLRELFSIVRLLKRTSEEFDLVCACNFPSYWATYVSRVRKPVIWLSSEVLGPFGQTKDVYDRSKFFGFVLRVVNAVDKYIVNYGVDPIVTCSELNCRLIKKRYGRDSLVLLTGVDYDFFRTAVPNAKADLGLGDGPLLLQVGALLQRKNQILSIQALKILKQRLGSVKLVLVGDGPWKAILQDEAKHLDLEDDVVFLGSISEDKLRAVYYACDVNLFPVKDQTWGLVPFEALVVGKPSIVAEGAGAAVVIGREKIGFLIKPNAEELAGSVLFALEHPELVKTMVEKGRRYVGENLTWEKYSLSMFVVFKSVLCPGGLKQTT